jgi:hypothetical protein
MDPTFVIAGRLLREYNLPPVGTPLLDAPGGSALYACGGLLLWTDNVGLLARVGEDYPKKWLKEIETHGADTAGIYVLQGSIDLRSFLAYNANLELSRGSPVSQFARRGLALPKSLLGYQTPPEKEEDPRKPDLLAPSPIDIPSAYLEARAVHLCPLDFMSHHRLLTAFKAGSPPSPWIPRQCTCGSRLYGICM